MPGAKDELRKEAFEMFRHGSKLKDIAEQLGVPAGTVRRWKCTDKWVEATAVSYTHLTLPTSDLV